MDSGNMMIAYVITKRGNRSFWNRVGAAFHNVDGSINVHLDALPVDGQIQLRDYMPRESEDDRADYESRPGPAKVRPRARAKKPRSKASKARPRVRR